MAGGSSSVVALADMVSGQEGDLFALLASKEELTTREGKPYFRVTFRDARREVSFPIWDNTPWAAECRQRWAPGSFYKLRATYRDTGYGPQLEIRKIREVTEADAAEGFDPGMLLPQSRFNPETMFAELLVLARAEIPAGPLRRLVETLLCEQRGALLRHPAAKAHHHAVVAGLLEHTLSMTETCAYLGKKYAERYPEMTPPLDRGLVVAGAILHDIGKLEEIALDPTGASYTPAGAMIGHLLLGRDMVRSAAVQVGLGGEILLRLEHLIIAHQRLPEWGSPKPPMTPEALIIHYADDLDAKFDMMAAILRDDKTAGPLTSDKNLLRHKVYRGGPDGA